MSVQVVPKEGERECTRCHVFQPLDPNHFNRVRGDLDRRGNPPYTHVCKSCWTNAREAAIKARNEKARAYLEWKAAQNKPNGV